MTRTFEGSGDGSLAKFQLAATRDRVEAHFKTIQRRFERFGPIVIGFHNTGNRGKGIGGLPLAFLGPLLEEFHGAFEQSLGVQGGRWPSTWFGAPDRLAPTGTNAGLIAAVRCVGLPASTRDARRR
ncbi:MAG: hypothetical protein ACLPTZ_18090, partial [Beijerinckiaceae bacterium]